MSAKLIALDALKKVFDTVCARSYVADAIAALETDIAQPAPDLLAERDKLKAANAELVVALEGMVEVFGVYPTSRVMGRNEFGGEVFCCADSVSIEVSELARAALAKNKGAPHDT